MSPVRVLIVDDHDESTVHAVLAHHLDLVLVDLQRAGSESATHGRRAARLWRGVPLSIT